ncbi:hypothetical protein M231_08109 [Tremella mesenterica]|uniref:Uncharacterized protein n=1 Tax=Tremella mesenterica TaxID=5217 RepID=A0A4Q1BD40_TREME|nr:hypothetical protein M231_08109 [Tremella mesenterica]
MASEFGVSQNPGADLRNKILKCVNVPEGNLVFLNRWTTEFRVCAHCYINTKTQLPCSFKKKPVEELFRDPSETGKKPKKVSQVEEDSPDTSSSESGSPSDLRSRSPSPAGPSRTRTIRTRSAKGVTKTKSPSPPLPTSKSKGAATSKARGLSDVPVQAPLTPKGKGKEVAPSDPQRGVKPPKNGPKWAFRTSNPRVSPAPTPSAARPQSEGETELSTSGFPSPLLEEPEEALGQDSLGQDGPPTSPERPNARQERPKFPPRPPKTLSNVPEVSHSETAPPPSHPGTSGLPIIVASSPVPRPTKRPLEEAEDSPLEPKRSRQSPSEKSPNPPETDATLPPAVHHVPFPATDQGIVSSPAPFTPQVAATVGAQFHSSPVGPPPRRDKSLTPTVLPSPSPAPKSSQLPNAEAGPSALLVPVNREIGPHPPSLGGIAAMQQWLAQKGRKPSGLPNRAAPNISTGSATSTLSPRQAAPPPFASQSVPPHTPPATAVVRAQSELGVPGLLSQLGPLPSYNAPSGSAISHTQQTESQVPPNLQGQRQFLTNTPSVPSLDEPAPVMVAPYVPGPPTTLPEVEQCLKLMNQFQVTQAEFEKTFASRMVSYVSDMMVYYKDINRGRSEAYSESLQNTISGVKSVDQTWSENTGSIV